MKVTLVSEGTYPFAMGGVSVWCDQLIRGMPDYRWDVVAMTVDGGERPVWDLPANLDQVIYIPLWRAGPAQRPGPRERPSARRTRRFLQIVLDPRRHGRGQREFLSALESLYGFARDGGDLAGALTANESLSR